MSQKCAHFFNYGKTNSSLQEFSRHLLLALARPKRGQKNISTHASVNFNRVGGDEDVLRLVFRHELSHYLLYKNGFASAGHNAFFIAAHVRICGGWREYQSSGALAMDKRQTAVWDIEKAQLLYKKAGGLNVSLKEFGENLAAEVSIKNHIFDNVFTDSKNGFKRFKILFFISAIILVSLCNYIIMFTHNL